VAAVILLWVQSAFYEDRVAAEAIYARAAAEFPRGVFFHYMAGYLARKDGRVEEALRRFERAMDSSTEVRELQLACVYERGWCYFVLNDFEHAVPLLERFLAEFRSPSFRAFAAFQLGYALDALGRIDDARAAMARVEGFVRRHFSFDQYARRKAREYLASARGLSDAERRLVRAANCVEALRWDAALALLREMERAGDVAEPAADADLRALWHYTLARALRGRRAAHAEIETQLQRVDALARQVRRETFVVSHALCEQGELRLEQGALAEAEALFQRARSALAECDFDKPLLRRLQLNLDTLAAARARRPRADSE
jgi:tetratricopeptide (TPR) repeat protein